MVDAKLREMVDAFSSGGVFTKDDNSLDEYLAQIIDRDKNALYLVDNQLRPEVVPAMVGVILSIKQGRLVQKLDSANRATQLWFMVLAIGSLILGTIQIVLGYVCR